MKPLANVRVVDFTEGAQGPFAASLLNDLGADVIKIERPGGEMMRHIGPFHNGHALPALTICHGREGVIELDLKNQSDRDFVMDLIASCTVLIQNWKFGAGERLGLGFEDVRKINPRIVYVRSTGYGEKGPYAPMGAMDHVSQAISGMTSVSGAPDSVGERTRTPILDFVSAFSCTEAAMIGIAERERTGEAVMLDVSQLSAALDALTPEVLLSNVNPVPPAGDRSRISQLGGFFACLDDSYVAIECQDEQDVKTLAFVLSLNSGDVTHERVAEVLKTMIAEKAILLCDRAEIPAARVARYFDASLFDEFPGTVRVIHDRAMGEVRQSLCPWIFGGTPAETGMPLGPIGRDNTIRDLLVQRWKERAAAQAR